ncbi:hypothetical protein ACJMK2_041998 [Sinanodonta woodiana]|uniref:protein-serine/threonine phosphatase n=1 Tax=Sinanodonta woodiana TaxID=1069815 RepID=A0ABD3W5Z6_SINWO
MGVYLSAPVTDKISIDKDCLRFRYGASSMQGWRMTQEDAHNCLPDFDEGTNTCMFAVYDGHGGAEVAQYCSLNLPSFIKDCQEYKDGHLEDALKKAFLEFDASLVKEEVIKELKVIAGVDDDGEEDEEDGDPMGKCEADMLRAEADMPLEELLAHYEGMTGLPPKAKNLLRNKSKVSSPIIRAKKPKFLKDAEGNDVDGEEEEDNDDENNSAETIVTRIDEKLANGHADNENNLNTEKEIHASAKTSENSTVADGLDGPNSSQTEESSNSNSLKIDEDTNEQPRCLSSRCDVDNKNDTVSHNCLPDKSSISKEPGPCCSSSCLDELNISSTSGSSEEPALGSSAESHPSHSLKSSEEAGSSDASGTSEEPACSLSGSSDEPQSSHLLKSSDASQTSEASAASESGLFPTAGSSDEPGPSLSGDTCQTDCNSKAVSTVPPKDASGEEDDSEEDDIFDDDDDDDDDEYIEESDEDDDDDDDDDEGEDEEDPAEETPRLFGVKEDDSTSDEPGADSGCTAVVALLRENKLIVANAGDSRCVMCRKGKAVDLSFDHKPEDEPERNRIEAAGGKVTPDGRVNGGLNLSRALGDHVYKQNKDLPPEAQMISALPDIEVATVTEEDEFVILACDGIWNFMSSQEVIDFVRVRLQDPVKKKKVSLICEEMFDHCLAPNTMGDGTGCDNMTAIILVFDHPLSSQLKRGADETSLEESQPEKRSKIEVDCES